MKTPKWFLKKTPVAYLLLPLAFLYFGISKLVYFIRLFGQKKSKRPVICVGNILAGGVGKTPIVRQISEFFGAPVVMRGYKKGANDMGDEAKMLQKAGISVYVGNRKENVELLNNRRSKTPIIFDDGMQNPGVFKDISIMVFDQNIGVGNGFVLPAGPLREPLSAIKRAEAIIIIGNQQSGSRNQKSDIEIKAKKYNIPVFYAKNSTINPVIGKNIAFAGIGYPQKFFNALKPKPIKTIGFPDHYQYTESDIKELFNLAESKNAELVTTEKDWVRLPKYAKVSIKYAPLKTVIEPAFWIWLKGKINENF